MLLFCAFSLAVSWIYLPREVSCSTREYFIAAVERNWDYAPSGQNKIKGIPLINDRYCEIQLWSNACIQEIASMEYTLVHVKSLTFCRLWTVVDLKALRGVFLDFREYKFLYRELVRIQ